MKPIKLLLLDKVSIGFVIFNVISYLIGILFYSMLYDGRILYTIVSSNVLNIIFGTPLIVIVGIIINLISLIRKFKNKNSINANIFLFVVYILMIPVCKYFFWQALMGV